MIEQIPVIGIEVEVIPVTRVEVPGHGIPYSGVSQINLDGLALPIADMPGCVEAHIDSSLSAALAENDPNGVMLYCDATMPSFNPPIYEPLQVLPMTTAALPKIPPTPESNADARATPAWVPQVPPPAPVVTAVLNELKSSKPVCEKYEIIRQGNCLKIQQPGKNVIQEVAEVYLPPLPAVTMTATIATVAAMAGLAAKPTSDFLLKLIKPIIKKLLKKLTNKKEVFHEITRPSVRERILAQRARNHFDQEDLDHQG